MLIKRIPLNGSRRLMNLIIALIMHLFVIVLSFFNEEGEEPLFTKYTFYFRKLTKC